MKKQPVVLYVEDDPRSRKVMDMMLSKMMQLPVYAIFEDSTNFLDRARHITPSPDIILLDIHVKPYSGFQMLEMLRHEEAFADTPVIALTASVMSEEIHQLRTAGFQGIIAKPVDIDTFPDLLHRLLTGEEIWRIIE